MMIFSPDLGFGDVKLVAVVGLFLGWFGWGAVVIGACLGWVAYAIPGMVRMFTRKPGERGSLPFGPVHHPRRRDRRLLASSFLPW